MEHLKQELNDPFLQNETSINDGLSITFQSMSENIKTITNERIEENGVTENGKICRKKDYSRTRNDCIPQDVYILKSDAYHTPQLDLVKQELDDTVLQYDTIFNDGVSNEIQNVPEDIKTIMGQIIEENRNIWNRQVFLRTRNNSVCSEVNFDNSDTHDIAPLDSIKEELDEALVKHEPGIIDDIQSEFRSDTEDIKTFTDQMIEENEKIWCREDFAKSWSSDSAKRESFNAGTDSTVNIFSNLEVKDELSEMEVEDLTEDSQVISSEETNSREIHSPIQLEQTQQNRDLLQSMALLKSKNTTCHICNNNFSRLDSLQTHIQSVHLKIRSLKCHLCDYSSFLNDTLQRHIKAVHMKLRDNKCHLCDFTTSWMSSLRAHIKSVHLKLRNYKCHLCDYSSSHKQLIQKHIRSIHMKFKRYKCSVCNFHATWIETLRTHMKSVHSELRKFKCHLCDYSSSRKRDLEIHISAVHLKRKIHKCHLCDYSSSQESNLHIHLKSEHLKLEKHKDDSSAELKSVSQTHSKSIHSNPSIYKCHICDFSSAVKTALQAHITSVHRRPKNLTCHLCDYTSSRPATLQMHITTVHSKLMNHKCDLCDFTSWRIGNVHKHMGLKHPNYKHECHLCNFSTSTKSQLQIHINSIHL